MNLFITFITFIYHYGAIVERLLPLALILIGFAILMKGASRKILVLMAFTLALLSIMAMVFGHGFKPEVAVSDKKVEFLPAIYC